MVELVTKVQGLLFPPDGKDKIASEDSDLFAAIMAEFNKFEIEVCLLHWLCTKQACFILLPYFSRVETRLRPIGHF